MVVTVERSSMNLDFNDENLINEGGPNKSDGVGKFLKNNIRSRASSILTDVFFLFLVEPSFT